MVLRKEALIIRTTVKPSINTVVSLIKAYILSDIAINGHKNFEVNNC